MCQNRVLEETKKEPNSEPALDAKTQGKNHPVKPIPDVDYPLFLKKNIPLHVQGIIASFLVGSKSALRFKAISQKQKLSRGFFRMPARAIATEEFTRILHRLAHRIKVEEILELIKKNPDFLRTLSLPITTTGRGKQRVTRYSIMGVLDALDEYDVTDSKFEASPCALIPTVRALFDKNPDVQAQIDLQLAEASSAKHQAETQTRHKRYLDNIEAFIQKVIQCNEISEESKKSFENNLDLLFVQNFIETVFQLPPDDKEELGVMFDAWQLCLDYIYLLNQYVDKQDMIPDTVRKDPNLPILGRIWNRKVDVVDTAVYLALQRFAPFCHLEVFAVGLGKVARGQIRPTRFNSLSKKISALLDGIGQSHVFGLFSGTKYAARTGTGRHVAYDGSADWLENLLSHKNNSKKR